MRLIEGIFYTNLDNDVSAFIAEIRQKENIDEYTIFVIFNIWERIDYCKYWKHHDCLILNLKDDKIPQFSNDKYDTCNSRDHKKYFDDLDLLEMHIKFTRITETPYCSLSNISSFTILSPSYPWSVAFGNKYYYTIAEFIFDIQENYPEFYKYDYSQIKPAICE